MVKTGIVGGIIILFQLAATLAMLEQAKDI